MRNLTLPSLKLGLSDLLDKRLADLTRSKAGKYYEPELREQLEAIDALPPALTGGAPRSAELDEADTRHDGHGGAIYYTTEAHLRWPGASPEIVAAAKRIRAAFIPELSELKATYIQEANRAIERKPLLTSLKSDLLLFPVAGGKTLLDVATAFLDEGERLHHLLSDRADVPRTTRTEARALRPRSIGLLGRLRHDLKAEIKKDAALPRDLEHRVFGYLDTLAGMASAPSPAAPPDIPDPVAPPAEPKK